MTRRTRQTRKQIDSDDPKIPSLLLLERDDDFHKKAVIVFGRGRAAGRLAARQLHVGCQCSRRRLLSWSITQSVSAGLLFEVVRLGNVAYDKSRLTESKIQNDSLPFSVEQELVCQTQSLHLHGPCVREGLCCPVSLIGTPTSWCYEILYAEINTICTT